ncbi:putative choline dehydrogenase [Penicillium digitatum]|uniref:Putative choline dehydrogenase n=1 Tax=Penicillium digitatum TaxID=36651 RepID=A0A7T6XU81_PENDI|nr:putative choline dehydrogenase [Penicillium digitatum]
MFMHLLLPLVVGILHVCSTTVSASPLGQHPAESVFDYVIVGSGPGGLTLANRLTENPKVSVAVIEAGTWAEDVVGNLSAVPGYGGKYLLKSVNSIPTAIDWDFVTTPQAGINNLVVRYPRGKVVSYLVYQEGCANAQQLGGSSNLNAMAWGESSRGAFSKWAAEVGDKSFTYENIAQYYKKPVRFTPYRAGTRFANATPSYDPAEVGHSGTLDVTYPAYAYSWTTWLAVMLEAAGMPAQNAYIDGSLNGSAWHMSATNQTTGKRSSADTAYLRPVLGRRNLVVFQKTLAERILFSHGNMATGVQASSDNAKFTLHVRKEVIVAGGVFQSPQILQVSGVGPRKLLKKHGIPVVADRPGVGQNMQDQIFADIVYRVNLPTGDTLGITEADIIAFNTNATGPLTNPGGEYGGFEDIPAGLRSGLSPGTLNGLEAYPSDWPDIQYLTLPRFLGDLGTTPSPDDGNNYASLMGIIMKPQSTGSVSISSASMHDPPIINPNWMTTDADLEVMVAIFKRMRQLWRSPVMKNITIGDEVWPGSSVESDKEIIAFLRETVSPMSHATSTCKMGKRSDPLAVVDSKGSVIGVKNLRVIDSSAMPFLPAGGEPQSVVYMLAEKLADTIKAEW